MSLLDFNSLVICNFDYNPVSLIQTMTYFRNVGIKNFIVTYFVDYSSNSSMHQLIDDYKSTCKKILTVKKPRGSKIKFAPSLYLSDNVLYSPDIKRLKPYGADLLFVQAPLFNDTSNLNYELNHLVFKKKLIPVFTCFENNLKTCPSESINSLFKLHNAIFCLDINFIINPQYEHLIHKAVTNHTTIIPCISNPLFSYPEIVDRFIFFRERIGDHSYFKICKHISVSCGRLW